MGLATGLPCLSVIAYTMAAARLMTGTPPVAAMGQQADRIQVEKAEPRLTFYRGGVESARYRIALGGAADAGRKRREGDERTPEGEYTIDWRNPRSVAHLSLHISCPAPADQARAFAEHASPGGNIMVHRLPNGWGLIGGLHRLADWTAGCIGVTNDKMREIWSRVPDGTGIEIRA